MSDNNLKAKKEESMKKKTKYLAFSVLMEYCGGLKVEDDYLLTLNDIL